MQSGSHGGNKPGFTIIEVLIVLVVSSALFLSASLLIGGKQNNTEFSQAIHQTQVQIQQIINDTTNGYYPNNSNFQCIGSTTQPPVITGGGNSQGTNQGCTFLGKALQFGPNDPSSSTVNVYTIIGDQQFGSNGGVVQSLGQANPLILANSPSQGGDPVTPDQFTLQYGLSVAWMKCYDSGQSVCGSGNSIGVVAFVSGPNSTVNSNSTDINSGSQDIAVIALPVALGASGAGSSTVDNLSRDLQTGNYASSPSGGVQVCFKSGSTTQSGLLSIGGSGRQTTLSLAIKGSLDCS